MNDSNTLRTLLKDRCGLHKAACLMADRGDCDAELRLYAVRCVRQVQSLMPSPYLSEMIDAAEQYALGKISPDEAWERYRSLVASMQLLSELPKEEVSYTAVLTVSAVACLFHDTSSVATDTAEAVRNLVVEVEKKAKSPNMHWQAYEHYEQMLTTQLQDFEAMFCQVEAEPTSHEPVTPRRTEDDAKFSPCTFSPQAFGSDSLPMKKLDAAWFTLLGKLAGGQATPQELSDAVAAVEVERLRVGLPPIETLTDNPWVVSPGVFQ